MDALLRGLRPGGRVLDLAAQQGSFDPGRYPGLQVVRVDLEPTPSTPWAASVRADAAALPFPAAVFDAVICNHGLEHFTALQSAVREMGRVLRPAGRLFLSAPDAGALSDRLYRFLASGGGHINAFHSAGEIERLVENLTDLRCAGRWTLFTSLSYLHPANRGPRRNRRFWALPGAGERTLRWTAWLFRKVDRALGTRLSVYGWAFYFGGAPAAEYRSWSNVCVRCGSGHPADSLRGGLRGWPPSYRCPRCGTKNFFTADPD